MTTGEPDSARWADFERLRMLYANLPMTLAASVASACLLTGLLYGATPRAELLSWLLAGILISSLRHADGRRFRRTPGAREAKGWTARFELGAAASGIFWGTAAALFFPHADLPHQVFIVFVLAGMCAGAMTAYGAMRRCYLAFVIPLAIPLLLRLVTEHDEIHYSMAFLTAIFLGVVTRAATEMDRTIGNALEVRAQNVQLTQALHYQATHDALVDLVNHREFNVRLTEAAQAAARTREPYALIFIDLDWFKEVNDQGGHAAGDETLRRVSQLFKEHIRATDTAGRLGGDEFAILLPGCPRERAERVAAKILASVQDFVLPWDEGRRHFRVGASIGVAYAEAGEHGGAAMLRAADAACYAAKKGGRGRIEVCRVDPQCEASGRFEISSLRKALP
jgi:diguanylate cyclase (GGDEF)-like protein